MAQIYSSTISYTNHYGDGLELLIFITKTCLSSSGHYLCYFKLELIGTKKLPIATYLHQISLLTESTCRLCNRTEETFEHFIVKRPKKEHIWNYHYPTFNFTNKDVLDGLYELQSPFIVTVPNSISYKRPFHWCKPKSF